MSKQSMKKFLIELSTLLDYAKKVYSHYIKNEKKFVYAKVLFNINEEIYHLVKLNTAMCPEERKPDALDLIFHLDVWRTIWTNEVEQKNPSWSDEFTFPSEITFPKQSVKRLLNLIKA